MCQTSPAQEAKHLRARAANREPRWPIAVMGTDDDGHDGHLQ